MLLPVTKFLAEITVWDIRRLLTGGSTHHTSHSPNHSAAINDLVVSETGHLSALLYAVEVANFSWICSRSIVYIALDLLDNRLGPSLDCFGLRLWTPVAHLRLHRPARFAVVLVGKGWVAWNLTFTLYVLTARV